MNDTPTPSFKERLLSSLAAEGVDEKSVARGLAQVIRGERVKKTYVVTGAGEERLVGKEVISTPKEVAQGAVLYDALNGGQLGLAPRQVSSAQVMSDMYRRFAPPEDHRIIQLPLSPAPVQDTSEDREGEGDTPTVQVLEEVASSPDDDEDGPF